MSETGLSLGLEEPDPNSSLQEPDPNSSLQEPDHSSSLEESDSSSSLREPNHSSTFKELDHSSSLEEPDHLSSLKESDHSCSLKEPDPSSNLEESDHSSNLEEPDHSSSLKEPDHSSSLKEPDPLPRFEEPLSHFEISSALQRLIFRHKDKHNRGISLFLGPPLERAHPNISGVYNWRNFKKSLFLLGFKCDENQIESGLKIQLELALKNVSYNGSENFGEFRNGLKVVKNKSGSSSGLHKVIFLSLQGFSPLHIACGIGDIKVVQELLKFSHIDVVSFSGLTPLHVAIALGHNHIVELLLNQMIFDVSGGELHSTPFNTHVHEALLYFCEEYEQWDGNIKCQIEYVLVCKEVPSILFYEDNFKIFDDCIRLESIFGLIKYLMTLNAEVDISFVSHFEDYLRRISAILIYSSLHSGFDIVHLYNTGSTIGEEMYRQRLQKITFNNFSPVPFYCFYRNVSSFIESLTSFSPTPLHYVMCEYTKAFIQLNLSDVSWLQYYKQQNYYGNLPLHLLCKMDIPSSKNEYLLKCISQCDVNTRNCDNETPFEIAFTNGQIETCVWLIINKQCDIYLYNREELNCTTVEIILEKFFLNITHINLPYRFTSAIPGDTLLHAVSRTAWSEEAIEYMVDTLDFKRNITNSKLEFPLHTACRAGHSFRSLQALSKCDMTHRNIEGNTPLDILVQYHPTRYDLMVALLTSDSFPNDCSLSGLILHSAQQFCNSDSSYLESLCRSSYNVVHIALELENVKLVKDIKAKDQKYFKEIIAGKNASEELPFHIAGRIRDIDAIKLTFYEGISNVVSSRGNTALHEACLYSKDTEEDLEAITYLIEILQCNPKLSNGKNRTPLHIACQTGSFRIVQYLLKKDGKYVLNSKDKHGCTPLMLTSLDNHEIIRILIENGAETSHLYNTYNEFFTNYSAKDPPKTPLHIIVVGKASSGKTTIIEALKSDESCEMVQAKEHTAGIIPSSYDSKVFGFTAWYDLAGQSEYYASHEAVLNTVMSSSTPLILLLTDCRKNQELIQQDILYWLHFLNVLIVPEPNSAKPCVIVVFSFADKLPDEQVKVSISNCKKVLSLFTPKFRMEVISYVALDCRVPNSMNMSVMRSSIKATSKQLCNELPIHFLLHCFYIFLVHSFHDIPAVTIEEVFSKKSDWISLLYYNTDEESSDISQDSSSDSVDDNDDIDWEIPAKLIPNDKHKIYDLCLKLHHKGHIILIKDRNSFEQSWLITNKEVLLSEINGSLFASPHFKKQFKNVSTSTGVVRFSTVKTIFPAYDIKMLVGFLVHLEYCQKITDKDLLHLLSSYNIDSDDEEYLFFPGLVRIEKPDGVWKESQCFNTCGWVLRVTDTHAFFTPRFAQVLLLRIAFEYPLSKKQWRIGIPIITLCRDCSVWKNGICWRTQEGIECLVEITEGSQAVILMMRSTHDPLSGKELADFAYLRSSLIHKMLCTLDQLSPSLNTEEYFCHPNCVQYPPQRCEDIALYSLPSIAHAACQQKSKKIVTCYQQHCSDIELNDLVHFEPLSLCNIGHIYHSDENEELSESFLESLVKMCDCSSFSETMLYVLANEFHFSTKEQLQDAILKNWAGKSYQLLKNHIVSYSIFRGHPKILEECSLAESLFHLPKVKKAKYFVKIHSNESVSITLQELMSFETKKGEKYDIIGEICSKNYYKFGSLLLNKSMTSTIAIIEKDHKGDTYRIVSEMVQLWLNGNGLPVSWESLVSVLNEVELEHLAEMIITRV